MKAVFKIYNWGNKKEINSGIRVVVGKHYVIQNSLGHFLGKAESVTEEAKKVKDDLVISGESDENTTPATGCREDYWEVIREADEKDLEKAKKLIKEEKKVLDVCRDKIRKYELPMKLVGATYSLDKSSIVVAFTAESRVDFRELVRDLSHSLQKAVRLEQIGSRDEARCHGGCGPCGRKLCCDLFNGDLKSINTEMARAQQITHRGSERISGCCGRLMCCLAYEIKNYEEVLKVMPQKGQEVVTKDGRKGIVDNLKLLKKEVLVKFEGSRKTERKWYPVDKLRFRKVEKIGE